MTYSPNHTAPEAGAAEVVLIMGPPGAGKSTLAQRFVKDGYHRLNRDEAGGTLSDLLPALDRLIDAGQLRFVLDNTYASRASRTAVVQAAAKRGLPVRCVWLATTLEDAQVNVSARMVAKYGRLLDPAEIRKLSRRDPGVFGPVVQFRYRRQLEPPEPSEGFSAIDIAPFERIRDESFSERAVIVWCEGVLRRSRSGRRSPAVPDDVEVLPGRGDVLRHYALEGWRLFALSWQPEVAENTVTHEQVEAAFTRTRELLDVPIDLLYCPHRSGPPACWCRLPLPGLGVLLVERHRLDAPQCLYVGATSQDAEFARRLGFQYRPAEEFFGRP